MSASRPAPPDALLAELTYRCPLRCGYCSNPIDLGRTRDELPTEDWLRVLREAATLGALHVHFSGGEPLLRDDLEVLIAAAHDANLYTNLITSAWGLTEARLDALCKAGLDHLQISLQDSESESANGIAGATAHDHKLTASKWVVARGLALSINVVLHRQNLDHLPAIIALAESLGASRLELANTQYHGWALRNRDALIPTRTQLDTALRVALSERERLKGRMDVIFVLPDYYTDRPKPCMDGWGKRFLTVTPDGTTLPCAGAHTLPIAFPNVRGRSLSWIWFESEGFNTYRGTNWMKEPCRSCDRHTIDHGGCRCQAFALTGDPANTDPACALSPQHGIVESARVAAENPSPPPTLYRLRTTRGA